MLNGWTGRGKDHQGEMKLGLALVSEKTDGDRHYRIPLTWPDQRAEFGFNR